MLSDRVTRRIALVAGATALVGMGALTACGSDTKDKPAETKSPSSSQSSAPAPEPTEKKVGPGGNNSFSPTVTARPAPTALPGNVITGS